MARNVSDVKLEMKPRSGIPEKVVVSWKDLTVTTTASCIDKCKCKGTHTKDILKNLNGIVKPGEMVALMGARLIFLPEKIQMHLTLP